MKGLVLHGAKDIRYENILDPAIEDERDVIVKIKACGICGSDLHLFHNEVADLGTGAQSPKSFCVGHEAVGEVVEKGRASSGVSVGQNVIIKPTTSCGDCYYCQMGETKKCIKGWNVYGYGIGLGGCQAEAVRVPNGGFNTAPIPEGISIDQAILLTDNLPTAYGAVLGANVKPGCSVAVVGLGPIGLMAVELSLAMGASKVFATDLVEDRRIIAKDLGATAIEPSVFVEEIRELTSGQMVDSIIEAVGSDRTMEIALAITGVGSTVSALGVNNSMNFRIPFQAFVDGVTVRGNFVTEVHKYWDHLVPLMQQGRITPDRVVTDRSALANGAEAYIRFDNRENGVLKSILYT